MLNKSEILKKLIQKYDAKTTRYVEEMLKVILGILITIRVV